MYILKRNSVQKTHRTNPTVSEYDYRIDNLKTFVHHFYLLVELENKSQINSLNIQTAYKIIV